MSHNKPWLTKGLLGSNNNNADEGSVLLFHRNTEIDFIIDAVLIVFGVVRRSEEEFWTQPPVSLLWDNRELWNKFQQDFQR